MIEDALFLKNDILDKKLIVTCSTKPNAELKVSELTQIAATTGGKAKQYQFQTIAQSREDFNGTEGFGCLSSNPINNEYLCSGGIITGAEGEDVSPATQQETGILIWKLD